MQLFAYLTSLSSLLLASTSAVILPTSALPLALSPTATIINNILSTISITALNGLPTSVPIIIPSNAIPIIASAISNSLSSATILPSSIFSILPLAGPSLIPSATIGKPLSLFSNIQAAATSALSQPTPLIPGLATDPLTMFNDIAEAIEILVFVEQLLQQSAGFSVPGVAGVGLGVNGMLINNLTHLAGHLIGGNVGVNNLGVGNVPVGVGIGKREGADA